MKQTLALLATILIGASLSLSAQNIKKKYSFRSNGDEKIYFIFPQDGFKSSDLKKGNMSYDITYATVRGDTATYNFSFIDVDPSAVDSVTFQSQDISITVPAKMIYVEAHKNDWRHRATTYLPYDKVKELYNQNTPYKVVVYRKKGKIAFEMKAKEWAKQSAIVRKIHLVMDNN